MGSMMSYTNGHIVRRQLEAITALGIRSKMVKHLERWEPALAALWALNDEAKYNWDSMAPHAVRELHYQAQTEAAIALRNVLVYDGELATVDQPNLKVAMGNIPEIEVGGTMGRQVPLDNSFMAFAWDPDRMGGDGMWGPLDDRIRAEWRETNDLLGNRHVHFPAFIWRGLTMEQRARVAGITMTRALHRFNLGHAASVKEAIFGPDDAVNPRRNKGDYAHDILGAALAFNRELHQGVPVGEWHTFRLGMYGESGDSVSIRLTIHSDGFSYIVIPTQKDALV